MKKLSVRTALASTLGLDLSDLEDYRYQPSRTSRPIYSAGQTSYCTGKDQPKDLCGLSWERHPDQFWAEQAGTVVWRSLPES